MQDKIVLVTGGIRGIGAAISKAFLQAGAFVIAAATNAERNQKWQEKQQQASFTKVATAVCDVTDYDSCQQMINTIKKQHHKIDILINNAGITRDTTFKKMTKEKWDAVIRTDLDSLFNVTHPVLQIMLENGYGRIINISSVNGQKGQFGQTNYAAAKAGVHGFTKSLALETATKNITVNTVSPGYINTEMMRDIPEDVMQKILAQIPLGRLGTVAEVANLVLFLAGEETGYITGANFSINGGLHMY